MKTKDMRHCKYARQTGITSTNSAYMLWPCHTRKANRLSRPGSWHSKTSCPRCAGIRFLCVPHLRAGKPCEMPAVVGTSPNVLKSSEYEGRHAMGTARRSRRLHIGAHAIFPEICFFLGLQYKVTVIF